LTTISWTRNFKTKDWTTTLELVDKIIDIYVMNSWVSPGQTDVVAGRGPGEEKIKIQKQNLLTTLKEAHAMFFDENNDCKVSS